MSFVISHCIHFSPQSKQSAPRKREGERERKVNYIFNEYHFTGNLLSLSQRKCANIAGNRKKCE